MTLFIAMVLKNSRIGQLLRHRLRVILQDGRHLVGQLSAFDKHMNLVLVDCEEFRPAKKGSIPSGVTVTVSGMYKRTLGLVILRGENIVSFSVESGPLPRGDARNRVINQMNPGVSHSIVRGSTLQRSVPLSASIIPPPGLRPV